MSESVRPEDIADAAEAVRWMSIWLMAINARNTRAFLDAQRTLRRDFGISICLTGHAAKDGGR